MRGAKTKWSNFHITINPNMPGRGREAVHALRDFCREMVTGDNLFEWLRQYRDGERREFDAADRSLVLRVRARVSIEWRGTQNRNVHAHVLVEIEHQTMVQCDWHALTRLAREWGLDSVNIQGRFVPGRGEDKSFILQYIHKEVPRHPRTRDRRGLLAGEVVDEVEEYV